MDLIAPDALPAGGIGDVSSVAALGGALGLAVVSGTVVALGWIAATGRVARAAVVGSRSAGRSSAVARLSPAEAGAGVGYIQSEWDERAFGMDPVAVGASLIAAAIALFASRWSAGFVEGSLRAGGSPTVVVQQILRSDQTKRWGKVTVACGQS